MKIKASDYIANFFSQNGIDTIFSITGGFSMHLSDSFHNSQKYKIYYQFHEQACAYSAIGYSRTSQKIPIVCTTAGCAVVNTLTPMLVAYQDSVPLLVISGQVKSTESITALNKDGIKLRHYAGADCDIVAMTQSCTKYSVEITDVNSIPMILKNTMSHLLNGRPGPVLLSIPLDIQAMSLEIDDSQVQKDDSQVQKDDSQVQKDSLDSSNLGKLSELLSESRRPIIIAGNGINIGNCVDKFRKFVADSGIPCVTTMMSTDVLNDDSPNYIGRIGVIGQRAGNFAVQNCDLVISLGCRMAQGVIGYRSDWFAREAKIIYIDIDNNELAKTNLNYTLKIETDLNHFFDTFQFSSSNWNNNEWNDRCLHWKNKWADEMPPNLDEIGLINPYVALDKFFKVAPSNKVVTCSSGSIVTVVWHKVIIKNNDRFILSSQGDMGFELPSAIGASLSDRNRMVVSISGEGALQLNIQELQTIVHQKLPIKIFVFNNGGYGANIITQATFFKSKYGCDPESDLSFPSTEKIANAYGIKYISARNNEELDSKISEFLDSPEAIIFEVYCCVQARSPKLSAFKNEDGTFTTRPFEDMEPFLSREEFQKEMIVKII
jgi:acetolactate synthase-1/2/3 large subunit